MIANLPFPPFESAHELMRELDKSAQYVPGHPHVSLDDRGRVGDLLVRDLCSDDLDRVADKLWWMSKQDSSSISPLHRQLVKRRAIIVTEDPKLHLVWIYDRIFIKPLPRYITSYAFWRDHLNGDSPGDESGKRIRQAALGYLRTYHHLIQHESDLRIAQDPSLCLVPADVTWEQFCNFSSDLGNSIDDRDASPRYSYGEIRLTRLNLYAPLLLGRSHFQRVEYQYGSYFARFYGPLLFVFGIASVVLSGLQVIVSVEDSGAGWMGTTVGVSVTAIVASCVLLLGLGSLWVYKVAREWKFAIRDRRRRLEERAAGGRAVVESSMV